VMPYPCIGLPHHVNLLNATGTLHQIEDVDHILCLTMGDKLTKRPPHSGFCRLEQHFLILNMKIQHDAIQIIDEDRIWNVADQGAKSILRLNSFLTGEELVRNIGTDSHSSRD